MVRKIGRKQNDQGQRNILSEYIGYRTTQTSLYKIILIVGGIIMYIERLSLSARGEFLADLNYRPKEMTLVYLIYPCKKKMTGIIF